MRKPIFGYWPVPVLIIGCVATIVGSAMTLIDMNRGFGYIDALVDELSGNL